MGATVLHILQECESRLSGVDSPRLSAEVLVSEVLQCSRLSLILDRDRLVTNEEQLRIESLVTRRQKGEPLAYILGSKEFYGFDFKVTPDTLIPRPETEHIIEKVEELYPLDATFRFADLGTGSGILAVTLAHFFFNASGVAVDLSSPALKVAQQNAQAHGVKGRLEFLRGDFTRHLFEPEAFDLIVSNPPYVSQQEYDEASHEVIGYEPETALVSGDEGLNHIRAMLPHVAESLRRGGVYLMEIGYQQALAIERFVADFVPGLGRFEVVRDLAGHDRIVCLTKL